MLSNLQQQMRIFNLLRELGGKFPYFYRSGLNPGQWQKFAGLGYNTKKEVINAKFIQGIQITTVIVGSQ